jgi:hypothetical protein
MTIRQRMTKQKDRNFIIKRAEEAVISCKSSSSTKSEQKNK